jgi:hypothetical protein
LIDAVADFKLLTAGQNIKTFPLILVNQRLEIGNEIGCPLNFVEDSPIRILGNKPSGIVNGELTDIRCLQIGVWFVGKDLRQSVVFPLCRGPVMVTTGYLADSVSKTVSRLRSTRGIQNTYLNMAQFATSIFILHPI